MSFCTQCGADVPKGSLFCIQCGIPLSHSAQQPDLPEHGDQDLGPSESENARFEVLRRFTPRRPDGPLCSFCKGPLDLDGEFCEQCGAPVGEAASGSRVEPRPLPRIEPNALPVVSPAPSPSRESTQIVAGLPAPFTSDKPNGAPQVRAFQTGGSQETPAGVSFRPEEIDSGTRPLPVVPPETPVAPPFETLPPPPRPWSLPAGPDSAASSPPAKTPSTPPEFKTPPQEVPMPGAAVPSTIAPAPFEATVSFSASPKIAGGTPKPSSISAPPVAPYEPSHADTPAVPPPVAPLRPPENWHTPLAVPPLVSPVAVEPEAAAQLPRKPFPTLMVLAVVGVAILLSGAAGWYFSQRKAPHMPRPAQPRESAPAPAPPATVSDPAPLPQPEASAAPLPELRPAPPESASKPRKNRRVKAAPPPTAPAPPVADPRATEIANLQNLARDAYAKGNFAEPLETCAITYAGKVLELDPADSYAKSLFENSVNGGKYQVLQAIVRKDFVAAHRTADALNRLLPGRADLAELKADIANAEKAEAESRRRKEVAAPVLSFRVYHMHSGKAPADKGPYCRGTLTVADGRVKYAAETALDQQLHHFEFACSEVREVKKNFRVASRENGFHLRTATSNINFVPEDSSASHIPELAAACSR
jgi:hypothetical protein